MTIEDTPDQSEECIEQHKHEHEQGQVSYADGVNPVELIKTVTTEATELWKQNEQLFVWLCENKINALLKTVPGGGKSYAKETVVPKIASETDRTFVLATTEYRNRQNTYEEVLNTLIKENLVNSITVTYIPSPREQFDNIPECKYIDGEYVITTPDNGTTVCQTCAKDENGDYEHSQMDDIDEYISQGATIGSIHAAMLSDWEGIISQRKVEAIKSGQNSSVSFPLPCLQIGYEQGYNPLLDYEDCDGEPPLACRYRRLIKRRLRKIERGDSDIIICGGSFLNNSDVVSGSTVIVDENVSGELVAKYDRSYFDQAIGNYIDNVSIVPNTRRGLRYSNEESKEELAQCIRDEHTPDSSDDDDDDDSLVDRSAPVEESKAHDRAEAPLFTLAEIEASQTEETDYAVFDPDDIDYTVAIDLQTDDRGNDNDSENNKIALTDPPQALDSAEQVIALDATGSRNWWEALIGVTLEIYSPNPLENRGKVVTEAFNTKFRQVSENMVSISRPNNMSSRQFLGILQAVTSYHDIEEVSIVTSSGMLSKIQNSEYEDTITSLAYKNTILHFGALRSDRTFEESPLHVVIGAPHPGDDPVRQRMALLGIDDKIVQPEDYSVTGEDRYGDDARKILEDIVHSETYQASRRAARNIDRKTTAHVYLYTRMFDDSLITANKSYTIDILGKGQKQDGGTEAILNVLSQASDPIETGNLVEQVNERLGEDNLSYDRIRQKLNELAEAGVVQKHDWFNQKNRWKLESHRHGTLVKKK